MSAHLACFGGHGGLAARLFFGSYPGRKSRCVRSHWDFVPAVTGGPALTFAVGLACLAGGPPRVVFGFLLSPPGGLMGPGGKGARTPPEGWRALRLGNVFP